jgi:hypothetical protein
MDEMEDGYKPWKEGEIYKAVEKFDLKILRN